MMSDRASLDGPDLYGVVVEVRDGGTPGAIKTMTCKTDDGAVHELALSRIPERIPRVGDRVAWGYGMWTYLDAANPAREVQPVSWRQIPAQF